MQYVKYGIQLWNWKYFKDQRNENKKKNNKIVNSFIFFYISLSFSGKMYMWVKSI